MRFLGVGDSCDLGSLYRRLLKDGHEVKVFVADSLCHGTMAGLVDRVDDWQAGLAWVRQAGGDGIILFENVVAGRGGEQDDLRRAGYNVIGGSAFGDRLENDRAYGQSVLGDLGLPICKTHEFADVGECDRFLDVNPGRYVLKFNGQAFSSNDNYVGHFDHALDVRAVLAAKTRKNPDGKASFILMEHVRGVEMGVGAYFDGDAFLSPACLDWEHKRFFPGDCGELTGEMGTVATYDRTETFFSRSLALLAPLLREHGYRGYINLNTIVNEQGIWPLEFTCRFGYPGFAVLEPLQNIGWAELFHAINSGGARQFPTHGGFAAGIVITTPPFPYTRHHVDEEVGLPVFFENLTEQDRAHLHYGELGLSGGQLVTSGMYGWSLIATGVGPTIRQARASAYELAKRVYIPNMRFRGDIGDKLMNGEFATVESLGLLDPL